MAAGGASLAPEERTELLAVLAADPDPAVAERAANTLLAQPPESFVAALAQPDAAPQLLSYCAENLTEKPGVADALARHPQCPGEVLVRVARQLSSAVAQELAGDLERLSANPAAAAALTENPSLTAEQKRLLEEILQETDQAALAEAVAAAEPDRAKRESLFQRLARMRVVERVQLALKGNREERLLLIRDPSKVVQRAVLQSPKLTEAEVEGFAAMANLSEDTLRAIGQNRGFLKNYVIVKNLTCNAKTPLDVTLQLIKRLNPQDLKSLSMNKNVPETLRKLAQKMYRQRLEHRKPE